MNRLFLVVALLLLALAAVPHPRPAAAQSVVFGGPTIAVTPGPCSPYTLYAPYRIIIDCERGTPEKKPGVVYATKAPDTTPDVTSVKPPAAIAVPRTVVSRAPCLTTNSLIKSGRSRTTQPRVAFADRSRKSRRNAEDYQLLLRQTD